MSPALFVWTPVALTVVLIVYLLQHGQFAFDFGHEYWVAGWRILHGRSLYAWDLRQIHDETAFAYPAASGLVFVPAALIPSGVGAVFFTAFCMACIAGTLWVLEIEDWRLYGLTMMWAPVVAGWQSANLTLPLVFALALVWRHRERPAVSGLVAGLLLSLKPFLWPVALWLLATRRAMGLAWCCGSALLINLIAWGVIGFSRIGDYVSLAERVTDTLYRGSYSIVGLTAGAGASRTIGELLLVVASIVLVLSCWGAGPSRQWVSLTLCVVLAMIASPLVDTHYFALLIVPLAIARRRLALEWLLPLLLWLCPESVTATWQPALAWFVVALVVYRLLHAPLLADWRHTAATPGVNHPAVEPLQTR